MTDAGPHCMACNGPLSWEAPGVYWCDICTVADRHGKTIEEVRRDVEQLAHDWTARLGGNAEVVRAAFGNGDTAIIHMEPESAAPRFDWPPVNRKQVAWEREQQKASA